MQYIDKLFMRSLRYVKNYKTYDTSYFNVVYRHNIRISINMRDKGNK